MRASGAKTVRHTVLGALVASLAFVGIVAVPLPAANAAPPANDDFANAQVISGYGLTTGTNVEATRQAGEPNHSGYTSGASVWYSWTAGASAPDVVIEIAEADFDPNLAVYTGSAVNALTQIEFDDDAGFDVLPRIELNPVDGTTYYIAVDACCGGFGDVETGGFQLRLAQDLPTGTVQGTVTRTNPADPSGPAIAAPGICVVAVDDAGLAAGAEAVTNASGGYGLAAPPGTYHLRFRNCSTNNVAGEFFEDAQEVEDASDIVVTGGGNQVVDAVLGLGGTISGTIGADGGIPVGGDLEDVCVRATMVGGPDHGFSRTTTTDADGDYTITGLDGGDYRVKFGGNTTGGCGASNVAFAAEYYNDSSTPGGATLVPVAENSTVDLDADLLAVPGAISGTVTAWTGGANLQNICVRTKTPVESSFVFTSAAGTYTIPNVAAGSSWVVEFVDCNNVGSFTTQYYDTVVDIDDAEDVPVLAGQTTSGIDARMFQALDFSGTILDENGNGRSPACVNVHTADGPTFLGVETGPNGTWSASVPPGSYDFEMKDCGTGGLEFETRWYLDELSQDAADKYSASQANMTQVLPGVAGTAGRITGVVTEGTTELEGICVTANGPGPVETTTTDADGVYEFGTIPAGTYTVLFEQCDEFAPYSVQSQYWDGVPVGGTPTNVVVTSGNTTAGIGADMAPGGTIEGIVTNEDGSLPLENICVTAYLDPDDPYPTFVTERFTNADGEYRLVGLPTDIYFLTYEDCDAVYAGQWYHGVPFRNSVDITPVGDPTPVDVTVPQTVVLDPTRLLRYATISGTITNEADEPLENVCAFVESDNPDFNPLSVYTDANGEYTLPELPASTGPENEYRIGFYGCLPPTGDYGLEFWDNKLDETTADLIAVDWGDQLTGYDAVLQDEPPASITAPDVLGQASIGMTLQATNGTWEHDPSRFTFQWYRCTADGSTCDLANDGTERQYLISEDDEGYRFKVEVTATNSKGSDAAMSSLTDVVDDAGPFNDDFADSVELGNALPLDVFGSNVRGTRQAGEPKHLGFPLGASVWYEWTAPTVSPVEALRISLDGSSYQTTLSVYDGPASLPDLELVDEDNGSGANGESVLTFFPEPGTTYYIAVDGNFDGSEFETGAIQMTLSAGSGIAGTVTNEDTDPVRSICVDAENVDDPMIYYQTFTAADGTYYIDAPEGEYIVGFTDCAMEYEDQYYDGVTDPEDATPVEVVDGVVTHDIDATLVRAEQLGTISGTVTDEDGDPIPNICVIPVSPIYGPQVLSVDCTDQDGTYLLRGLGDPESDDELEYYVWFDDCSCFWGSELWNNIPYDYPDDAELVSVSRNDHVTDIDATMQYLPPVNTALPVITGNTAVGATLTTTEGVWTHEPGVFLYQWLQCDALGANCTPITDADEDTYVTTAGDDGHRIRVDVTAVNSIDEVTVRSWATGVIGRPGNITLPVISGSTVTGSTMTSSTGTWTANPTGYSYQWLRCNSSGGSCAPISLATNNTYVTTNDDAGSRLKVDVTATNAAGSSTARSAATAVIGAPTNTALPTISGSTTTGATLSSATGTWTGSPTGYTYQWLRCDNTGTTCTAISLATNSSYATTNDDVGSRIRLDVTATNASGSTTARTWATGLIGRPGNVVLPAISGSTVTGSTMTSSTGTWTGNPTGYSYQWLRCDSAGNNCAPISLATNNTYVTTNDDIGSRLKVDVTATNAVDSTTVRSAATALIGAPTNTALPTISGGTTIGATLTSTTGTWTGSPTGYAYQWLRCDSAGNSCTPISLATNNTYVTTNDDSGHRIRVDVTATNAGGNGTARSWATGLIGRPANIVLPTISGSTTTGSTMTATNGTWSGNPTSYSYQWLRCDSAGSNCTAISLATNNTYVTTNDDIGSRLKIDVTATNSVDSTTARSAATGVIGAPTNTALPTISGGTSPSATLTVSNGTWTGSPTSYAYQWLRCDSGGGNCSPVNEATASSLSASAHSGFRLRVDVTATNAAGSTTVRSWATGVIG